MSFGVKCDGNNSIVRRAIDVNYEKRKRSTSLKWSVVNLLLLLMFVYDLWGICPGQTSLVHYVEGALAAVLAANLVLHGARLLRRLSPPPHLTPQQRRLLGLAPAHNLSHESSFNMLERSTSQVKESNASIDALEFSTSLSSARAWRSRDASPSPSRSPQSTGGSGGADALTPSRTHSPPSPPSPSTPSKDEFIADTRALSDYLKEYEERSRAEVSLSPGSSAWGAPGPAPAPHYQLAALDTESSKLDEGARGAGGAGSPLPWWRLHLDPQELTQFNLNLRLWLHLTILERLVAEMGAAEAMLTRLGAGVRLAEAAPDALRKVALHPQLASLRALLPYIEPFADQRYVVQRIKELAKGGCLSNYKWNGGGSEWDESKPTDAELVLHLFATYVDGQAAGGAGAVGAGGGGRPFSTRHISAAPAPPPRAPDALAVHRVTARPPHYVLVLGEDTLEVSSGRCNLLHTLLLFLAAAAARAPPALCRLHLGPAGLNMLWIIGR